MDRKRIGYWIATALFSLGMGAGGFLDLTLAARVVEVLDHLGYPHYFGVMLGAAKLAGVLVLLLPSPPRLKEWAYAGFTIDLVAAFVSHACVGDGVKELLPPVLFLLVGGVSYVLRPQNR